MKILSFLICSLIINLVFSQGNIKPEFYTQNDTINLYVFIGEKIFVEQFDPSENNFWIKIDPATGDTIKTKKYFLDAAFKVRYKVLAPVFNDLKVDTIDFEAYDHYGRPAFEKEDHVILYLVKDEEDGKYYHLKYQFDMVWQNKRGDWKGEYGESIKRLFKRKKKNELKRFGIP